MQRLSALITLLLFMFILSWVGLVFQEKPLPLREGAGGGDRSGLDPQGSGQEPPGRLFLPGRQAETPVEDNQVEIAPEEFPLKDDESEPLPFPAPGEESGALPAVDSAVHFLLLGRKGEEINSALLMVVSLIPGRCARLTVIDPGLTSGAEGGDTLSIGQINPRNGDSSRLYRAVEQVSGLAPQFYIELNLDGFKEMVDLLGGVETGLSGSGKARLNGAETLALLTGERLHTGEKEKLIIDLLVAARDVENTRLGLKLLWTGYKNIRTDLTLADLIQLRRVSHTISPFRVSLREITPDR